MPNPSLHQNFATPLRALAAQSVPQLSFAVADAEEPVAGPGEFDAVLAFHLLHLVTDRDRALQLAVQALPPGGLLISKPA